MSDITSKRRPNLLGVHSLDHFSIAVPDLSQAADFYDAFGLVTKAEGSSLALQTHGSDHSWGKLVEGPKKQLHHLSFAAYADDLPRFKERLEQRGIKLLSPPVGLESDGLWFHGHDGVLTEICVADKSSPDVASVFGPGDTESPARGTYSRSKAPRVYPRRMSHVAIFTPDVGGAIAFYSDVLGLRLSDRSADIVAFLHGVHGSDHHMIALVKSGNSGFHHCSWDIGSAHEVGLGASHMAGRGHDRGWGLGRHVLGSNYFHYVRDPWGSYSEYSAGMDYVPSSVDWQGTDQPVEDAMFLWGPNPPEDFAHNYETP
ncbi:MAG: metapyrocatechase 2 [Verrucomicrobiaceae bacterium]|nr:metapyrocatechase 2 [Verrucomicrobiaceae bacterium]